MEYIPAKKFEGMKQGMAFKMGEKGLGYYKDGPTIISIEETLVDQYKVKPIQLNLDALVGAGSSNDGEGHRRRGPNGRGHRAKGPLSCGSEERHQEMSEAMKAMRGQIFQREGEHSLSGPYYKERSEAMKAMKGEHSLSDSVFADSTLHRKMGLWAIDSVNGNSWSSGSKFLEFS